MSKKANFDLSKLGLGSGVHIITAKAKASGYNTSRESEAVSYMVGTEGLNYALSTTGDEYVCTGVGSATATDIVIAPMIDQIPVTRIAAEAFYECVDIKSVTIPDSITSIGEAAFSGCRGITGIVIPDSVTEIGSSAFSNCSALTEIAIPKSVVSIGSYAFSGCDWLIMVSIPASVTSIGACAFKNCGALVEVEYLGTAEQWDNIEKGNDNTALNDVEIRYVT